MAEIHEDDDLISGLTAEELEELNEQFNDDDVSDINTHQPNFVFTFSRIYLDS